MSVRLQLFPASISARVDAQSDCDVGFTPASSETKVAIL